MYYNILKLALIKYMYLDFNLILCTFEKERQHSLTHVYYIAAFI